MASDNMEVAALGRPFTLGMLYNAHKDELIPGITLWDDKTVQAHVQESAHQGCNFQISASDSIEEKSSLLDVEASLKASFLGGLVEVGGSAKYLNDQKKFKNQSRVTLQYKATTNFKQLSITLHGTNLQQTDVVRKCLATHVVTGILYGANAFFVFDSEKLEGGSVQEIQGSMEAVIKKLPAFDLGMEAQLKLTDEEQAITKKFSCTFYGDFLLESNPAMFEEAVKTYAQLPKLLGQARQNAVPLKVWLMPLKTFDSEAAQLMCEIRVGLVRKIQDAVEDIRQLEMRCNDCLEDTVVKKLPQIHQKLSEFQDLCDHYASALRKKIAKKLQVVRAGEEPERSLEELFEEQEKSPFSHDKLAKWMDLKEREINVIRPCVRIMEGTKTKIVSNKNELDREVLAQGVEDALCFVFTSLENDDTCLRAMTSYLYSPRSRSANDDQWFFSAEVFTEMKKKAKAFHDLAKALKNSSAFCFLVAAVANEKYKGATIYHYKGGVLVTDNFTKPEIRDVTAVKNRSDVLWYACDLTLDPDTANNYLTLSEGNKKATCEAWQTLPDHPDRFNKHVQVLCRESLSGRHYWEVEWSNGYSDEVGVAVTYNSIGRKGGGALSRLGHNAVSWYFGHRYGLYAWHNALQCCGPLPYEDCRRVGVYLDKPAGTLSFYRVSSNTLSHLHTFNTRFTEPVYPALWVWQTSSYVSLCPFE